MTDYSDLLRECADSKNTDMKVEVVPVLSGNDEQAKIKIATGDVLPILPLRNMVLFSGVLLPVTVARPKSIKLVKAAYEQEELIAV